MLRQRLDLKTYFFAKEICSDKNCNLIDTIPDFQNYKNENINWSTELYFLNDEHFNDKGANLLFNSIVTKIK